MYLQVLAIHIEQRYSYGVHVVLRTTSTVAVGEWMDMSALLPLYSVALQKAGDDLEVMQCQHYVLVQDQLDLLASEPIPFHPNAS